MQNRPHDWLFRVSLVLYAIDLFLPFYVYRIPVMGIWFPLRDALFGQEETGFCKSPIPQCPDRARQGVVICNQSV